MTLFSTEGLVQLPDRSIALSRPPPKKRSHAPPAKSKEALAEEAAKRAAKEAAIAEMLMAVSNFVKEKAQAVADEHGGRVDDYVAQAYQSAQYARKRRAVSAWDVFLSLKAKDENG